MSRDVGVSSCVLLRVVSDAAFIIKEILLLFSYVD